MKNIILSLLLFWCNHFGYAQDLLGPRLLALGNSGAAIADLWSLESNSAGITSIKLPTLGFAYAPRFFDPQLKQEALTFVVPLKNNYLGLGIQRYGISEYQELTLGFAYVKKFGTSFSLAVKANYHQLNINNYGKTTAFSIDIGALYQLNEHFSFGGYLHNPAQLKYASPSTSIQIPTQVHLGVAYHASNKITLATSLIKKLQAPFDVALGIDYQLLTLMSFRAGLRLNPFKQYLGLGLTLKRFNIDFALENNPNLGYSPQIALAYAF